MMMYVSIYIIYIVVAMIYVVVAYYDLFLLCSMF